MNFGKKLTINIVYTGSQNYTNMVVGEHGIQTIEGVVDILLFLRLLFDVFAPTNAHPLLIWTSGLLKYTYMPICIILKFYNIDEIISSTFI